MQTPPCQAVPRCRHQIPSATQGQHHRYAPTVLQKTQDVLWLICTDYILVAENRVKYKLGLQLISKILFFLINTDIAYSYFIQMNVIGS